MRNPLVLLVEDEALIALALMDDLEVAGYEVAGPFHRCRDTLDWLQGHTPDVAIIDIHLRDGSSTGLAQQLRDRGVPFIVFSGEKRDAGISAGFEGARWLGKPAASREVLQTVGDLLSASARTRSRPVTEAAAALAL
jgi:DNA-binding response OmpR family regulator